MPFGHLGTSEWKVPRPRRELPDLIVATRELSNLIVATRRTLIFHTVPSISFKQIEKQALLFF